jgi:hypothetical protein
MADAARIGSLSDSNSPAAHRHAAHGHGGLSFQDILDRAFASKANTGYLRSAHPRSAIQNAAARAPAPLKTLAPAASTSGADAALTQAMALENVPASWQPSLHFIMTHESGGHIGVHNPVHSARGLFQLTAANYHLNPNGAASFGNGVEEAQGGIRYIKQRYGTADNAVAHWQQHHWY